MMLSSSSSSLFGNAIISPSILSFPNITSTSSSSCSVRRFKNRALSSSSSIQFSVSANNSVSHEKIKPPSIYHDSLRALQWDQLCDSVASFSHTSLGRQALKAQLWSLNQSYEQSLKLLDETNAAVQMHNHGSCSLDFSSIDLLLVKSAIQHAQRSQPMYGNEAMAIAALLQSVDFLQFNLKAAIKEDADWYSRFMPLSEVIMGMVVNQSLIKSILKVVDEDGSVKDSASSALRRSRDQVRILEQKLYQLMDSLIRNTKSETSFLEVGNVDGRWCIQSNGDQLKDFKGLLLSSAAGVGTIIEPLPAVPLNDELQQARASMAKAEEEVLFMLTEKVWVRWFHINRCKWILKTLSNSLII